MRAGEGADGNPSGELTLAFDLAALRELAYPGAVFADARRWSRYVGVVGDDTQTVSEMVDRHGLRQDFELGSLEPFAVLSKLKWEADTERYVLVGSGENDRELAKYVGWEYLTVREAAEKADWTLLEDLGSVRRSWIRLIRRSSWWL